MFGSEIAPTSGVGSCEDSVCVRAPYFNLPVPSSYRIISSLKVGSSSTGISRYIGGDFVRFARANLKLPRPDVFVICKMRMIELFYVTVKGYSLACIRIMSTRIGQWRNYEFRFDYLIS